MLSLLGQIFGISLFFSSSDKCLRPQPGLTLMSSLHRKSLVVSAHAIQPDLACLLPARLLLRCCATAMAFTRDSEGPSLAENADIIPKVTAPHYLSFRNLPRSGKWLSPVFVPTLSVCGDCGRSSADKCRDVLCRTGTSVTRVLTWLS